MDKFKIEINNYYLLFFLKRIKYVLKNKIYNIILYKECKMNNIKNFFI